jgi:cardiolipin synthase
MALALGGSANLDERSLFLNYELMMAFFEPADMHLFAC